MKLSTQAWNHSLRAYESIKAHKFNQELTYGTLALDKFSYYIEQDCLYLEDFARSLALIASKISSTYVRKFLNYAEGSLIAEQEVVHSFFEKKFEFTKSNEITPATLNYTSYLLRMCALEPVEVGIAAILPCFWVYREIGKNIAQYSNKDNPFAQWIVTYSSHEFSDAADEAVKIFDEYGQKASDDIKAKMINTFYNSVCLEWHFWNDAYYKTVFHSL